MLLVGDHGKILCGFEGEHPHLIPDSRMKAFQPPPDNLPESPGAYREWLNAIRGGEQPRANFDFEQHVVEAVLLGSIAVRASTRFQWDSVSARVTALDEGSEHDLATANSQINPPRRSPWELA